MVLIPISEITATIILLNVITVAIILINVIKLTVILICFLYKEEKGVKPLQRSFKIFQNKKAKTKIGKFIQSKFIKRLITLARTDILWVDIKT